MRRITSLGLGGAAALVVFLSGCNAEVGTFQDIEPFFSGGVPITARPLVALTPGAQQVTIEVTWPSSPARTSQTNATFQYIALDMTDPDNPVLVPTGDALAPIVGDDNDDYVIVLTVAPADTKTLHSVNIASTVAKEYHVLVMVSMTYERTKYGASGWFVAKP